MSKKCLVIGANGFLGSHLVDALVAQGENVRAFDRYGGDKVKFQPNKKVDIFTGNFLNKNDISNALKGIDYVFHFISTTTPASAENDPLIDIETNVRMSVELFQECASHKVKKVIFASTGGAIYGEVNGDSPISESTITRPISPYAIGKLTIENYLGYFKRKYSLDSVSYRISNPYGERQSLISKQGVIPIFLHHIAKDEPVVVLGDGSMVRDYLYVKDVAELITSTYKQAKRPVYNLGSGRGVSIDDLVEIIRKVTNKSFKIKHQDKPLTFIQNIVLDTSLFRSDFGMEPKVTLEDGIKETWQYIKSQTKP